MRRYRYEIEPHLPEILYRIRARCSRKGERCQMSQVEVAKAKFPWIQLVIFTAILGAIENTWLALQPEQFFHFYIFGIVACPLQLAGGPFIVLMVAAFLSRIPSLKKWLTLGSLITRQIMSGMARFFWVG